MRKLLKYLGLFIGSLTLILVLFAVAINKRLPEPNYTPEADALAEKVQNAVDKEAWDQINYIQFTFAGKRHYIWDKVNQVANIQWDNFEVILDLNKVDGLALENKNQISGEDHNEIIQKAWEYWCNDSFWLTAPFKLFDPGTKRGIITDKNGHQKLMITYDEGGVTPGDSYLWELDENYRPTSWQMWVQKLPIGGIGTQWNNWTELPGGAQVATQYKNKLLQFEISNLNTGQSLQELHIDKKDLQFL